MDSRTGHLVSENFFNNMSEEQLNEYKKLYKPVPDAYKQEAIDKLNGKDETYVDLTKTKTDKLARLCEQWRKLGFTNKRIKQYKKKWKLQNDLV